MFILKKLMLILHYSFKYANLFVVLCVSRSMWTSLSKKKKKINVDLIIYVLTLNNFFRLFIFLVWLVTESLRCITWEFDLLMDILLFRGIFSSQIFSTTITNCINWCSYCFPRQEVDFVLTIMIYSRYSILYGTQFSFGLLKNDTCAYLGTLLT